MAYFLLRYRWRNANSSGPREKIVQAGSAEDAAGSFTNEEIKEGLDATRSETELKVRVYEIPESFEVFGIKPAGVTVTKIDEKDV